MRMLSRLMEADLEIFKETNFLAFEIQTIY